MSLYPVGSVGRSSPSLFQHVHECGMGKVPFPCYLPFSPRPEVVLLQVVVRVAAVAGSSGDLSPVCWGLTAWEGHTGSAP
jgi:hypothetical protein